MKGVKLIEHNLKTMPSTAGVYKMLAGDSSVLYVGKAKNLKKRVSSYTNLKKLSNRIANMVLKVEKLEIITTRTEAESLLLESNLIKELKPRYNILLRDDKSFPYITISGKDKKFPRIEKHRGVKKKNSSYFGPYASAGDVNSAISAIQKAFLLRPCADSFMKNRKTPCMEYQIKRCSAPCVNKISQKDYASLVKQAEDFLSGKASDAKKTLQKQMDKASAELDYERAAIFRDRITALTNIQASQSINAKNIKDADIIALHQKDGHFAIEVFFIRSGQTRGNKAYFPTGTSGYDESEVLEAFINNFYLKNPPPKEIILSHNLPGKSLIEQVLSGEVNHKVKISFPLKGEKRGLVEMALSNCVSSLERKIEENLTNTENIENLKKTFGLNGDIERIEVYDNSHIFGKSAVGAMIVAGKEGFIKNSYRKFNVDAGSKKGGDDYYMLEQVLRRRFKKGSDLQKPDFIMIDGGKGHLSTALRVFEDLNLDINFACISKGEDRNAGREEFHIKGKEPFRLPEKDPFLFYLQRLRDEAHRFAISSHRSKRAKNLIKSELDEIGGIGSSRKKALLNHFGSVRAIKEASISEISKVSGISSKMAQNIHDFFC